MANKVIVVPPPGFKGRVELPVARHLLANIENACPLAPLVEYDTNPGAGFYHLPTWAVHQSIMARYLLSAAQDTDDTDTFIFTDFWFPGLDIFKLALEAEGKKPTLIGFLHGASFVDGDLMQGAWAPHLEKAWMEMYDRIWAGSNFFIQNMPKEYLHKVRIVGEPYEADELIPYRRTTLADKTYDIVYPHRLAPDKGFDDFERILDAVSNWADPPSVLVTGGRPPEPEYAERLALFPFVKVVTGADEDTHLKMLASAKVVLSTAIQEGWGYAVMKAVSVGCVPVLPNRAVYPELYPPTALYDTIDRAVQMLGARLAEYPVGALVMPTNRIAGRIEKGELIR